MPNLDNVGIAELLSQKAEEASYPVKKALRRAGRAAFLWREEGATLLEQGRSLTELPAIGPYLENLICSWIEKPPDIAKRAVVAKGLLKRPTDLRKKPVMNKNDGSIPFIVH